MNTDNKIFANLPLDVAHVSLWKEYLISQIGSSGLDVTLDLSGQDECDSAGIQLLFSAKRTAENSHKLLRIVHPNESVLRAATHLGIDLKEKFQIVEE